MGQWEFDYELNWTWWTLGVRFRAPPYDSAVLLIGLGPLLLVWTKHLSVEDR